ncbi:YkoP family protein [Virgibacillus chiguensis]
MGNNIEKMLQANIKSVGVEWLMFMRNCFLYFWGSIDPIYFTCSRLTYIVGPNQKRTLLRARLTKYKGAKMVLSDGTVIEKDDLLVKIHLHNVKLLKKLSEQSNDMKRAVIIYHSVKKAMPSLATYIENHAEQERVKGIIGITNLSKGGKKLGFEEKALQNKFYRIFKKITLFPISFLTGKKSIKPVYLFMSKGKLLMKYGNRC